MADLFDSKNILPMLLYEEHEPFDDEDSIFELKLDGVRCIAYPEPKSVVLQNKRFKDVSAIYPELSDIKNCVKKHVVLDGELVVMTDGKPDFYALSKRALCNDEFKIRLAAKKNPVQFVAFDILYYNGKDLTELPLMKRKEILFNEVAEGYNLGISRYIEREGKAFFNLAKKESLEGIVAKKKDSLYHIGKRTRDWLKIKVMKDEDLLVCGFTTDDVGDVKDVILGYYDDKDNLVCRGKVYLGISKTDRKIIKNFTKNNTVKKPWFDKYKNAVWLKPELVGTAHFMHETENGGMRQPVWKGLRDDK